jgi:hypothetical protein
MARAGIHDGFPKHLRRIRQSPGLVKVGELDTFVLTEVALMELDEKKLLW